MKICNSILFTGLLFIVSPIFSQQLFTTTEVSNAYLKGTRTTTGKPKSVEKSGPGSKITIENKGGLPLPVYVIITFVSGEGHLLTSTAEVWKNGNNEKAFQIKYPFTEISKVELGDEFIPDKYKENNVWVPKK